MDGQTGVSRDAIGIEARPPLVEFVPIGCVAEGLECRKGRRWAVGIGDVTYLESLGRIAWLELNVKLKRIDRRIELRQDSITSSEASLSRRIIQIVGRPTLGIIVVQGQIVWHVKNSLYIVC